MVQFNSLIIAFLAVFLSRSLFQFTIDRLNVSHLREHGTKVPEVFQDVVDQEKLVRISAYTADSAKFGIVVTIFDEALLLAILLSGFLPWLAEIINRWQSGSIVGGLVFFAFLAMIFNLLHIPFGLYSNFVIESRYGFNTRSLKMWFTDWIKSMTISAILGCILLWSLLTLVYYLANTWWLWAWMMIAVFELLMVWLYPAVIAPLFNKFEPIVNKELEDGIVSLMRKAGLRVRGVLQMDASKRSKHTNAYFTGIGRTKRIVLFDTLLASHPDEEILSVLAHEVGHWKRKHILKQLIVVEILSLMVLYLLSKLLNWPLMYQTFGFQEPVAYVGLFLVGTLMSPIGYFVRPLESAISRKFECEADDIVFDLMGTAKPMRNALIRLTTDNLANLVPHPLYAWFYYSHPSPVERISRLENLEPGSRANHCGANPSGLGPFGKLRASSQGRSL